MRSFEPEYWTVTQAAVWVVYRSPDLLEKCSDPPSESWHGLKMYPSMHKYEEVAKLSELANALENGILKAFGLPNDSKQQYIEIPNVEWSGLTIAPPIVYRQDAKSGKFEPWTDIKFRSADMKRQWPSEAQSKSRELHDWEAIEKIWRNIVTANPPPTSKRKIIILIQERYGEQESRIPLSRSQMQKHMKEWQVAD